MDSNNELTFAHDALITSITYVIMFYNCIFYWVEGAKLNMQFIRCSNIYTFKPYYPSKTTMGQQHESQLEWHTGNGHRSVNHYPDISTKFANDTKGSIFFF